MTAAELAKLIPDLREVKPGKYEGPCPLHGGKSGRGFLMTQFEGSVGVLCRGGCNTEEVLAAVGLKLRDLFSDGPDWQDPEAQRKARSAQGLEKWRQRKLTEVCVLLRKMDSLVADINAYIQAFPDEQDSEEIWDILETVHGASSFLEFDFERLNSKNTAQHLEVYREHQEVANAA